MDNSTYIFSEKSLSNITVIFAISILKLSAQNLVLNPSFELFEAQKMLNWHTISGSPDIYFGQFNIAVRMSDQKKYKLNPTAFKGVHYLGLAAYLITAEAIQGTLVDTLIQNRIYEIEIHVIRPKYRCLTSAYEISVGFASIPIKESTEIKEINLSPVLLKSDEFISLSDSASWMKVRGEYAAKGGEKYVIISNFTGVNKDVLKLPTVNQYGIPVDGGTGCYYYYYDLISVTEKQSPELFMLDMLTFNSNSFIISEKGMLELNRIINLIKDNPYKKIQIIGHTDNVGSNKNNIYLSEKRAESVSDYFVKKGIEKNKILSAGMGENQPISSNSDELGRQKNRRIEIIVKK